MSNEVAEGSWVESVRRHEKAPWVELDAIVELTLVGAPGGDHVSCWELKEGHIDATSAASGTAPDVVVAVGWKDAVSIAAGEVDIAVAYMRGKLKPSGDMDKVLKLLEQVSSDAFASWAGALRP